MQENKRIDITKEHIRPTAERMHKAGHALVMIHGLLDKEGQFVISYDYDLGPLVESYVLTTTDTTLPSISDIYDAAAAWPEKELEELAGLQFEGLDLKQRLFLPEDMLDERGHILVTPLAELRESYQNKD